MLYTSVLFIVLLRISQNIAVEIILGANARDRGLVDGSWSVVVIPRTLDKSSVTGRVKEVRLYAGRVEPLYVQIWRHIADLDYLLVSQLYIPDYGTVGYHEMILPHNKRLFVGKNDLLGFWYPNLQNLKFDKVFGTGKGLGVLKGKTDIFPPIVGGKMTFDNFAWGEGERDYSLEIVVEETDQNSIPWSIVASVYHNLHPNTKICIQEMTSWLAKTVGECAATCLQGSGYNGFRFHTTGLCVCLKAGQGTAKNEIGDFIKK